MHVLEDRQARHQPRRQRRASEGVRIDHPKPLLEEAPVDRSRELHHRMSEVDNLVEPRPEDIALPRLPTFLRPHESPRRRPRCSQGITAPMPDQCARKPVHNGRNPANTITSDSSKFAADQELGSFSRTTIYELMARGTFPKPIRL